jgi:hypothetical protein
MMDLDGEVREETSHKPLESLTVTRSLLLSVVALSLHATGLPLHSWILSEKKPHDPIRVYLRTGNFSINQLRVPHCHYYIKNNKFQLVKEICNLKIFIPRYPIQE